MPTNNNQTLKSDQLDSILFLVAGSFMMVNVIVLWLKYLSIIQLSVLWAAIPGIVALTASIIALFKLYPRISSNAPRLTSGGAGFAVLAGAALSIATIWIFGTVIFDGHIPEPLPSGILALIGIFVVSLVIAFICYALAFLIYSSSRGIGILLLVPVASWCVILVAGIIKSFTVGLTLDLYTNIFIAVSFLTLGFLLRKDRTGIKN
jgi:hypothetical protein